MTACIACLTPVEAPPCEIYHDPIFDKDFPVFECPKCAVVFTPLPKDFPLAEWYSKAEHFYGELEREVLPAPEEDYRFRYFFESMRKHGMKGRLLDVGAGDGRFLKMAKESGWEGKLSGIEVNPDMRRRIGEDIEIEVDRFEDYFASKESGEFDAISLFDVIEHFVEPRRTLKEISRLLKPGGWLAINVPNNERILLFGREAFDYPPHHTTRFSMKSLADFVALEGFEVIEVRAEPWTTRSFSDRFFYALFRAAMPWVKRLLFGRAGGGDKTMTELQTEGGGSAMLPDRAGRVRAQILLRKIWSGLTFPIFFPISMFVLVFLPHRSGDAFFLLARKQ